MAELEGAAQLVEQLSGPVPIEVAVIEGVAEMQRQSTQARSQAEAQFSTTCRAAATTSSQRLEHLVEQAGATRHRVVEEDADAFRPAQGEQLKVVHLHLQHLGGSMPQGLHDAVGFTLVRAALQSDRVSDDIGMETDPFDRAAAAIEVVSRELVEIGLGGKG